MVLISVGVECDVLFKKALRAMSSKLQHLEYYYDIPTCECFLYSTIATIYRNLPRLTNLHTLKIMAIKNSHVYEKLRELPEIKQLTLVTMKNNFLPKLYKAIKELPAEKIIMEEWNKPNIYKPLNPPITKIKKEYIKTITESRAQFEFTEKLARNCRKYINMF